MRTNNIINSDQLDFTSSNNSKNQLYSQDIQPKINFRKYKKKQGSLIEFAKNKVKSSPSQLQKNQIENKQKLLQQQKLQQQIEAQLAQDNIQQQASNQENQTKNKSASDNLRSLMLENRQKQLINLKKSQNSQQTINQIQNNNLGETLSVNKSKSFVSRIRGEININKTPIPEQQNNLVNNNKENNKNNINININFNDINCETQQSKISQISRIQNNKNKNYCLLSLQKTVSQEQQNNQEQNKIKQQIEQLKQDKLEFKWKKGDLIGQGSFGQVYRAMNLESGQIFAVKKYNLGIQWLNIDPSQVEIILNELEMIQKMKHNHIVNYFGHQRDQDHLYIYMEYMSGGSISQLLKNYGPFNMATIQKYSYQILQGLSFMHQHKIIHQDLKGSNVLVSNGGLVKISDFGTSNQIEQTLTQNLDVKLAQQIQGSIPWMAPEMIQQSNYGRKADVWGFGCLVLEMATANRPWSNHHFDNPIQAILTIGQGNQIPYIPHTLPSPIIQFIQFCLVRDYHLRPTVDQLLEHSFIKNSQYNQQ